MSSKVSIQIDDDEASLGASISLHRDEAGYLCIEQGDDFVSIPPASFYVFYRALEILARQS